MAKVLEVDDVQIALAKSNPPQIIVDALGKVSSSGWTDGQLSPYTYFMPPQDGIIDFDFIATPPSGIALTVLRPITASTWFVPAKWFKGVRIHAATGEPKVKMLYDEDKNTLIDEHELRVESSAGDGSWISSGKTQGGADGFPWLIAPKQR